jgi:hypothetical protein
MRMTSFEGIGKLLIVVGLFLLLMGGGLLIMSRFSIFGSRLPWDILYRGEKVTVFFPIGTCVAISVVLTVLLNLFFRR